MSLTVTVTTMGSRDMGNKLRTRLSLEPLEGRSLLSAIGFPPAMQLHFPGSPPAIIGEWHPPHEGRVDNSSSLAADSGVGPFNGLPTMYLPLGAEAGALARADIPSRDARTDLTGRRRRKWQ